MRKCANHEARGNSDLSTIMQIVTLVVLGADAGVVSVSLYHALAGGPCLIGVLILIYEIIMTILAPVGDLNHSVRLLVVS